MILSMFLKTCILFGLVCSGVDNGPSYRDVQMQQHSVQATRDVLNAQARDQAMRLQATRQAVDASVRATAEAQHYAAQHEQRSIEATQQARRDSLQATANAQQVQAHATSSAVESRERTDRIAIMQTGMTERLYKTQIERTERLSMVIDFLVIVLLGLLGLALFRYITNTRQGGNAPAVVQIDTIPAGTPRIPTWQFVRQAEQNEWEWDIYEDAGEKVGFRYLSGRRIIYLLEDKQQGAADEPMA